MRFQMNKFFIISALVAIALLVCACLGTFHAEKIDWQSQPKELLND